MRPRERLTEAVANYAIAAGMGWDLGGVVEELWLASAGMRLPTEVCSLATDGFGLDPIRDVLCDRRSAWGNPFHWGEGTDRVAAVAEFRRWVWLPGQRELRARAHLELRACRLFCHCAPLPCHCDVWVEVVDDGWAFLR